LPRKNKYCYEIIDVIDEEICETAPVYGKNKKCSYDKVDKKCEEIDAPDDDSDKNKENSGINLNLSKIFIVLFILISV